MCWTWGQFAIKVNCKHTEYQGLCQLLDFKCHLLSTQKQDRDAEEVHRSSISLLSTMLVIGFVGVGGHFLSSVFGRGHSKHFYQPWRSVWPLQAACAAVVRSFLIPRGAQILRHSSLSKLRPWSVRRDFGTPYRLIKSTKQLATVTAFWSLKQYTSTHFVNRSEHTST